MGIWRIIMLIIKLIQKKYLKNLNCRNLIKDYFYNNFLHSLMKISHDL